MGSTLNIKNKNMGRDSGIELLKIAAILLIILNHCVQTLTEANGLMPAGAIIDIESNTTTVTTIILAILRSAGCVGNDIFVACSAWFLIGSKGNGRRKALFLLIEVWVVSVIIFAVTYAFGCDLDRDETLNQFMPTTNGNNWFVTCYIMLMLIYPFINKLIDMMSQRTLLGVTLLLVVIYSLLNYFRPWFLSYAPYYMTDFVVWIMIYFLIAYIKLYLKNFSANVKANFVCLLIGLVGQAAMIIGINVLGLNFAMLAGKVQYFNYAGSPFILLIAVGGLNLARKGTFKCKFINYVSSLSLLVYIIHENYVLRYNYRPLVFKYIYENFGYGQILLWLLFLVIAIFIVSALISAAFKETVERLIRKFSNWFYEKLARLYGKLADALLKIN